MKVLRGSLLILFLFLPLFAFAEGQTAVKTVPAVDQSYEGARECYHQALSGKNDRAEMYGCASMFVKFAKKNPGSSQAPNALFSAGLAYKKMNEWTGAGEDAKDAIKRFDEVTIKYPKSSLADDSLFNIAIIRHEVLGDDEGSKRALSEIIANYKDGDMYTKAESYLKKEMKTSVSNSAAEGPVWEKQKDEVITRTNDRYGKITSIKRIEGGTAGETVTLAYRGPVVFSENNSVHQSADFSLYTISLNNVRLSRMIDTGYSYVGQGVIKDIDPVQNTKNNSKIDFVIKKGNTCQAKKTATEIVITCAVAPKTKPKAPTILESKGEPKVKSGEAVIPAQAGISDAQLSQGKKYSVVIDPGHGGKDTGAIGPTGKKEKDVALQIAKRLGWQLRNRYNVDVNYTRIDDHAVSLDDRVKIADGYHPDIFVSVHANAAESRDLDGYQTFFLNNASDDAARKLAARENASMGKNMDDLEKIILKLMQNANTEDSRDLGKNVHKKVLSGMSVYALKDRGLKSALFYVLVGSKSPSILIETSFISNPEEEKRLGESEYQELVSRSIAEGISDYLSQRTKPAKRDL